MTIKEELLQLRLIEGQYNRAKKNKMLEQLQTQDMLLDACVEILQQIELIDHFITTQENTRVFQVITSKEKEEFDICKYEAWKEQKNVLPLDKSVEVAKSGTIFQVSAGSKIRRANTFFSFLFIRAILCPLCITKLVLSGGASLCFLYYIFSFVE